MNKKADLTRAVLFSVSGGVLTAVFGVLGAADAHAEPRDTAGSPSLPPAKKSGDGNSGSANAAEHRIENAEKNRRASAAGSEKTAEHRRENAEKREEKATREGSKKPSGSANAAERRQENADKKEKQDRQKADSGQSGRNEQRERRSRQDRWEKASPDNRKEAERSRKRREEAERKTQENNAQQTERNAREISAGRDYNEALKGGSPGSGMWRQVENAQHKADRLAAEAAKPGAGESTRRRAAAARSEVERLEHKRVEQNDRQAARNRRAAVERARAIQEQQHITAGMHDYAEAQRGGNPGSGAARARREEQLRMAQGQLDYNDAIAGKPIGERTAEIVERTLDGRSRVTNARTGHSVVRDMPLSSYVHPAPTLPVEVNEVVNGDPVRRRETLEVGDWQKLPDGRHPGVSVGTTSRGRLVAVSYGKLPQEVRDQLTSGWTVESGTAEDGRDVTIFHPRSQHQTNIEDLGEQWRQVADKGSGELGEALAGTGAAAVDTLAGLGQTNVYGTGKDCLGSDRNCDAFREEGAMAFVGVTPLKGVGLAARGAATAARGVETAGRAVLPRALAKTVPEAAPRLPWAAPRLPRIPRPPLDPGADDLANRGPRDPEAPATDAGTDGAGTPNVAAPAPLVGQAPLPPGLPTVVPPVSPTSVPTLPPRVPGPMSPERPRRPMPALGEQEPRVPGPPSRRSLPDTPDSPDRPGHPEPSQTDLDSPAPPLPLDAPKSPEPPAAPAPPERPERVEGDAPLAPLTPLRPADGDGYPVPRGLPGQTAAIGSPETQGDDPGGAAEPPGTRTSREPGGAGTSRELLRPANRAPATGGTTASGAALGEIGTQLSGILTTTAEGRQALSRAGDVLYDAHLYLAQALEGSTDPGTQEALDLIATARARIEDALQLPQLADARIRQYRNGLGVGAETIAAASRPEPASGPKLNPGAQTTQRDGKFRSPNPAFPPNQRAMAAMKKQPIEDPKSDCSEIAQNLLKAAGVGKIVSFTSSSRQLGETLLVPEGSGTTEYIYHHVYTDGRYVYDPRLSPNAVPWGDYLRTMKALNPALAWGKPGFAGKLS